MTAGWAVLLFAFTLPQDWGATNPNYLAAAWVSEALRDFVLHIGLIIAVIALVAWRLRMKRWLIAAAIPAVIVLGPAAWRFTPGFPATPPAGIKLKVMSCNLLWRNPHTAATVDEVLAQKPDIVLLQEYAPHFHAEFSQRMTEYPYRLMVPQWSSYGAAIYSRFPFVGKPVSDLRLGPLGHPQMRAVIDVKGRHVAVYDVHLEGPHYLYDLAARRREFADLLSMLGAEPLPVIIGGDFNLTLDTPQGYALRAAGLRDAHDSAGYGLGVTWPVIGWTRYAPIPGFRIDHVFVSAGVTVTSCRTGDGHGSDHRPLIAEVIVP